MPTRPRSAIRNHITTSLSIVESRSNMLVQRAVDPTKLEFLSQVYKRKDESHLLESAQNYLTTLHKVSEILSRAASVEALFDSIVTAILEVTGGDRAAILMRNKGTADVDLVAVRTKDGHGAGAVTLSRTVVHDVLDRGISAFTDDALEDERYGGGESIVQQRIRSVMCAPLRTTDEILGVLYVDSMMAREFGEAELELLAAIGNQAGIAMHRARLMTEVERLFLDVMKAIASIIDAKDGYTHQHSERVAAFGVRLARQLGFDADSRAIVELSGLLHDVGKIGVPDAILNKPGKLTDTEFKEMRLHPLHGVRILSNIQSDTRGQRPAGREVSPRALGRQRLSGRAEGRGDSAARAGARRGRLPRCPDVGSFLPQGSAARRGAADGQGPRGAGVRSGGGQGRRRPAREEASWRCRRRRIRVSSRPSR